MNNCGNCNHAASSHGYGSERWDWVAKDGLNANRIGNRGCGTCACTRYLGYSGLIPFDDVSVADLLNLLDAMADSTDSENQRDYLVGLRSQVSMWASRIRETRATRQIERALRNG